MSNLTARNNVDSGDAFGDIERTFDRPVREPVTASAT